MWNWNRKPIVPLHLVATIFIAIGVSVALLGFVLSEVFLPVGLVAVCGRYQYLVQPSAGQQILTGLTRFTR